MRCIKCNEVAPFPDVFGQTDSVKSAACNYVGMQGESTIQRAPVKREEEDIQKKKLRPFIFGSLKSSDSTQQAALKLAKEWL